MASKIIRSTVCGYLFLKGFSTVNFVLAWTTDQSNLIILGSTTYNTLQVRMPMGDSNSTLLHLIVRVRDIFDSVIEMNMSPISVLPDTVDLTEFMTTVQSTFNNTINDSRITSNPFIQILYGNGYQNDICQWLISISRVMNQEAKENLLQAIESMSSYIHAIVLNLSLFVDNIPAVSISVSSLNEMYNIVRSKERIHLFE
jgi:hypothetical protein